ncbi:MAG: ABC transporter substrate-binding protein [Syntrophomonadaceae bacterium]|nr:ABC transporter substrate-binding protein [Syntrophomonadaceae bacterium]MDD3888682.1 ABC transporter substrate-binding protein [Syntrophomonadaceae bacterium]MDD4548502.1 ABC transporter substrate-binding protein [Syntrophomonadaceae bacterium]
MKKSLTKVTMLVLMLFVLGIVAGCGGNAGDGGGDAADIPIGINCELSGGVASYGTNAYSGAELAVEQINAAGGVLGKQLRIVKRDNKSLAEEAASVSASMVEEGIVAQVGPLVSSNVQACTPILMESQIPLIAPAATATNVTVNKNDKTFDYIFRVCFIDPFQGTLMARFAKDDLNAKTAVIYKDTSSDYAKGLAEYFKKTFEADGGTILTEEGFVKDDRDFKATLTKIKTKNPDFIYVPGYYQEVAPLLKQARELGITIPIGGGDGWDSPDMLKVAGPAALNNSFFTNHYSSQDKDPKIVSFVDTFKAKYNKEPDAFAALGYDSVQILVQAIKDAGEADPVKIKDALANIKDFEGITGKMTIDEQHNPVKAGVILEYKDGNQVMNTRIQP